MTRVQVRRVVNDYFESLWVAYDFVVDKLNDLFGATEPRKIFCLESVSDPIDETSQLKNFLQDIAPDNWRNMQERYVLSFKWSHGNVIPMTENTVVLASLEEVETTKNTIISQWNGWTFSDWSVKREFVITQNVDYVF